MFKGLVSEVSIDVGKSAAIMINQLFQWWKSDVKRSNKIYRTNQELHEDLCGVLSIATIQRCKQKLIDKGYIEVSFDKGLNRVTHYSLTEKALSLLDVNKRESLNKHSNKHVSANNTANISNSGTTVTPSIESKPKHAVREQNRYVSNDHPVNNSKAMRESFEEGFTNKNAIKCPIDLLSLIKKNNKATVEQPTDVNVNVEDVASNQVSLDTNVEDVVDPKASTDTKVSVETSWEDIVSAEKELMSDLDIDNIGTQSFENTHSFDTKDEYISDNDYGDCDVAMMKAMSEEHSIDNHKQGVKLSFSDLMKKCFDRGFTDDQEKLYSMKMNQQHFVEDY